MDGNRIILILWHFAMSFYRIIVKPDKLNSLMNRCSHVPEDFYERFKETQLYFYYLKSHSLPVFPLLIAIPLFI